ncbi:MAG: hypothetical protein NTV44_05295 [Firmicutes bacterium]|nr:hypothetical protein [Bacillota bacterium]
MSLKKQIKKSGQIYFETHAPDVSLGKAMFTNGVDAFNTPTTPLKKKFFTPRVIWSFSSASVVLVGAVVFALVLNSNTPTGNIDFRGLTALNTVNFPSDSEVQALPVSDYYASSVTKFMNKTAPELYSDETKSFVYSPISAYYALSLLLEGAKGETYNQLAALLGVADTDSLHTDSKNLYKNLYYDVTYSSNEGEKKAISKMGNAVYVNENQADAVKQSYLDTLASEYYAEAFKTDFSTEGKQGIADWLNDKTNDFLNVQPTDIAASPDTLLALFNTIYLKNSWINGFDTEMNFDDDFTNTGTGLTQTVTYMRNEFQGAYVDVPGQYSLLADPLYGGNKVLFVLPADGVSPKTILSDGTAMKNIVEASQTLESSTVHLRLPKHKTFNKYLMNDALIANGVTDVFTDASDLSNIIDSGAAVSSVIQNVGVAFEERGVEAAAYTEVDVYNTAMPNNEVNFYLDHSFIYVIVSPDNIPLFVGVTNAIE